RSADLPGFRGWVNALDAGASRYAVALGFLVSPERRGLVVDDMYLTILHRHPDPVGRAGWVNYLLGGGSEANVVLGMLLSPEYQASHPDNTSYVQGLYQDLFGRVGGPSEVAVWVPGLAVGAQSRASLALVFLSSQESLGNAIQSNYLTFLGHGAD